MVEFQYNSYIYIFSQQYIFLLNTSCLSRINFELYWQKLKLESIMKFTVQIKSILEETKLFICKFQKDIRLYYNQRQILVAIFKSSNKIYLDFVEIQTIYFSTKLSHQYLRPYVVKKLVGLIVYYLKLLLMMKKLYLVFNIIELTATYENLISSKCLNSLSNSIFINR